MPPLPRLVLPQPTSGGIPEAPVVGGDQPEQLSPVGTSSGKGHPTPSAAVQEGEQHQPGPLHDAALGGQWQTEPALQSGGLEPPAQDSTLTAGDPSLLQQYQGMEPAVGIRGPGPSAPDPVLLGSAQPRPQRKQPGWFKDFNVDVKNIGCEDAILFKGGGSVVNFVYWPRWSRPQERE